MKLICVTIENYKLIENTGEWKANQVTCLIGKNESGKSATLEALHKLKPDDKSKADFSDDDFPRRYAIADKRKDAGRTDNVVTSVWLLEPVDVMALADKFPELPWSDKDEIVIRKGYDNKLRWTLPIKEDVCVKACVDDERIRDAARAAVAGCDTFAVCTKEPARLNQRQHRWLNG